jgi:hypothetical protein
MTLAPGERAMKCACGHTAYPRVSPAMMVLVKKGTAILLARNVAVPAGGRMSALAGFVEPGESIEDAIHREVREEVGVEVTDLRYFGSQSWPLPALAHDRLHGRVRGRRHRVRSRRDRRGALVRPGRHSCPSSRRASRSRARSSTRTCRGLKRLKLFRPGVLDVKRKQPEVRRGFRVAFGNKRVPGAEMVIAPARRGAIATIAIAGPIMALRASGTGVAIYRAARVSLRRVGAAAGRKWSGVRVDFARRLLETRLDPVTCARVARPRIAPPARDARGRASCRSRRSCCPPSRCRRLKSTEVATCPTKNQRLIAVLHAIAPLLPRLARDGGERARRRGPAHPFGCVHGLFELSQPPRSGEPPTRPQGPKESFNTWRCTMQKILLPARCSDGRASPMRLQVDMNSIDANGVGKSLAREHLGRMPGVWSSSRS